MSSIKDVYDSLTAEQKVAVEYLVGISLQGISKVDMPTHVKDAYNSLTELQKHTVRYMIDIAKASHKRTA